MSQRILIVGQTLSGKSSLARKLILPTGLPYYVRDPNEDEWEGAKIVTPDMEIFKQAVLADAGIPRIAVVDEAYEVLRPSDVENHCVFARWRHDSILPIVIAMRMMAVAPIIRMNASDIFIFESSKKDCETLAEDKNCDEIMQAKDFCAGDYLHWRKENGKGVLTRHRLW